MAGWRTLDTEAVVLPVENIDTDQLIPARFMSVPRSEGYGDYLLHDMRRDATGDPDPAFPLNARPAAGVLLAGRNFGCGSSREAAVYALVDAGIRAVIAPSFGDIFAGNAVNNGLLPARVSPEDWDRLAGAVAPGLPARVDIEAGTVTLGNQTVRFDLDESWRVKLINGWDDIDLTRQHSTQIGAFKEHRKTAVVWAWPATV